MTTGWIAILVTVLALFIVWARTDIHKKYKKPAPLDEKPYVTLIRVGPKPGFYLDGKHLGDLSSARLSEIVDAYTVYDFWQSPEAAIYNQNWWLAYGWSLDDALKDIASETEVFKFLTTIRLR